MSPDAQKVYAELQRDADGLGHVSGSQADYRARTGVGDVQGALVELVNSGHLAQGNFQVTPLDPFTVKLTGVSSLTARVMDWVRARVGSDGSVTTTTRELASELGCPEGDAHEALINLKNEGLIELQMPGGVHAIIKLRR